MRIALVSEVFPPKIDGITNRLTHTIRCLAARGHHLLVVAPDSAAREHPGARVVRVPSLPFPAYPGLRAALPDPRLGWELGRFRPDVVHAVGPACLGVWAMLAARALGLPLVASYHTDFPRYLPLLGLGLAQPAVWPLMRRLHNLADVNLCPSRFTRDELVRNGVRNVALWRGGVDTARFHPGRRSLAMRARLAGGRIDAPILLYVGRLSFEKNLESFERLLAGVPEAHLALVGDGPARPALERALAGRPVTFTGYLQGDELAAAYASADLFVMPSRTETLGFVVLEAMSSGCPVVAADAGGLRELVRDGENGLSYHPEQPEAGARLVRELLRDPGRRRFLALGGRKTAEETGWERATDVLLESYRRAAWLRRRRLHAPPPRRRRMDDPAAG